MVGAFRRGADLAARRVEYVWQTLRAAWEYHDAPDEAFEDLYSCIEDTAEKVEADEPATGAPTLEELLEHGKAIAKKIKNWLGWGDLTPEQREEVEWHKRVKRSEKTWGDERVRKLAHEKNILTRVYEIMHHGGLVGESETPSCWPSRRSPCTWGVP